MANSWNWYYNHITGLITQMFGGEASLLAHEWLGWHGPYPTKEDALAFYNANKAAHPDWQQPKENIVTQVTGAIDGVVDRASDTINDPFHIEAKIGMLENWFVRGGEIVLGIVLIAVGLSHLSGGGGGIVGSAFKVGKAAAKLAK